MKRWQYWLREIAIAALGVVSGLLLFALTMAACLAGANAETMWVNVDEQSHLNGRSKPVTGDIEAKLLRGWTVEVLEICDGWALVDGYGESGGCWVDVRYLTEYEPGQMEACEPVDMRTTVGKLRVRSYPDGEVLYRMRKGNRVTVLGWMQMGGTRWGWIGTGWVMAEFLEVAK